MKIFITSLIKKIKWKYKNVLKKNFYNLVLPITPKNYKAKMFDPFIDEDEFLPEGPMVFFIATNHDLFKTYEFPKGSVVIDPWRIITFDNDIELVSIGVS